MEASETRGNSRTLGRRLFARDERIKARASGDSGLRGSRADEDTRACGRECAASGVYRTETWKRRNGRDWSCFSGVARRARASGHEWKHTYQRGHEAYSFGGFLSDGSARVAIAVLLAEAKDISIYHRDSRNRASLSRLAHASVEASVEEREEARIPIRIRTPTHTGRERDERIFLKTA